MEASVSGRATGEDDNSIGTGYNSNNVKKARLNSTLSALLEDPILMDVPKKPTLSDVDTLISLELGSAMRISVLKLDGTSFDVVVMNSATVKVLKLAIKKKINEMEQSKMGHRHISWRHVWANFCLSYHNDKLLVDNSALQDFGIRNNSQVQFVPYVVARVSGRHSRRRKHRFFHGLNKRSAIVFGGTTATLDPRLPPMSRHSFIYIFILQYGLIKYQTSPSVPERGPEIRGCHH